MLFDALRSSLVNSPVTPLHCTFLPLLQLRSLHVLSNPSSVLLLHPPRADFPPRPFRPSRPARPPSALVPSVPGSWFFVPFDFWVGRGVPSVSRHGEGVRGVPRREDLQLPALQDPPRARRGRLLQGGWGWGWGWGGCRGGDLRFPSLLLGFPSR